MTEHRREERQPWGGFALAALTAAFALGMQTGLPAWLTVVSGLVLFGRLFALNSSIHSYLNPGL